MEHGIIEIVKLDHDTYLEILKLEMINCHTLNRTAESLKDHQKFLQRQIKI